MKKYFNQKGQMLLTIILIMTIALAIGLSVVQKSLIDISTATKTEESSQAFSVAEAGVEKALLSAQGGDNFTLSLSNTNSNANITDEGLWPKIPLPNNQQDALEFPPLTREDTAQVWFADPQSNLPNCDSGKVCYKQPTFEVYWGNSKDDQAAISLKFIYYDGTSYISKNFLYDPDNVRAGSSNFQTPTLPCKSNFPDDSFLLDKTNIGVNRKFYCMQTINTGIAITGKTLPILVRIRLLYNTDNQAVAIRAVGNCDTCAIPPQIRTITSTGLTGNVQRTIQLSKQDNTVLPYFDYAVFSAGDIQK